MHPVSNSKREFPISDRRVDENLEHFIRDAVKDDRAVIYPFQVVDFLLNLLHVSTQSHTQAREEPTIAAQPLLDPQAAMRLLNGSALLRLGHRYRA